VGELLATTSSRELMEWGAFFKIDEEMREMRNLGRDAARNNATRKKAWEK
jgi:hypothetical protein